MSENATAAAEAQAAPAERGVVQWFNDAKGYGFIKRQDGTDVFVHYTAIQGNGFKTLKEGQEVEMNVVKGKKGLQAENVSKVE